MDGWIQAYPVNQALQGGWNRDFSCGEEKFDPELRQKLLGYFWVQYGDPVWRYFFR